MSSVPMQGVVLSEATTEKRRGARGDVGNGTPSKRVKNQWLYSKSKLPLKAWAREMQKAPSDLAKDCKAWFAAKAGGTEAELAARADRRERLAALAAARKSKGSDKQINVPKKKQQDRR